MKWPPLLLFLGWLAVFPGDTRAKEPDGPPSSQSPPTPVSSTLPTSPRPSLLRQNPAVRFHLILGRLQLDPVRYRKGSQSLVHVTVPADIANVADTPQQRSEPVTEALHVDCNRGIPSMRYLLSSPAARISIDAESRGPWRIESKRTTSIGTVRVIVNQTPGLPIVLKCISDAPELSIQAATWLHLREADRAIFAEHLEPIADELLWPYQFHELANAAQAYSLGQPDTQSQNDQSIASCLEKLRSPSRADRTNAERELRAIGIALLPTLAKLDWSSLDAEQQRRLLAIQSSLTPLAEDDSIRLANLIHNDSSYWRLAQDRLDGREQQIIAMRFGRSDNQSQRTELATDKPGQSPRVAAGPMSRGR